MPPVTKANQETFRKDVDFVAKDDEEQVATGIVMVPDKVDLQNDFIREDLIREFAEQFGDFIEVDQADGGIMHAAWPSDWMTLERNEVLDEAQEIGGVEAPEGAWIQSWKFNEDELWQLVADDILSGYSIGGVDVHWDGPIDQDDLEDVEVPDEIDEEAFVWEIVRGIIREVSTVDIPAVPDAMILETKDAYEKRLADHLGNRDGFIEEAQQRGHTEGEAERLWDVLNEAIDLEGAGEPGDKSWLGRAKAFFSQGGPGGPDRREKPEKEGRTLSRQNRHSEMASIDASLDVLEDAGVDHGMTRFTDRDEFNFDLTEHSARTWADPDEDEDEEDASPIDNAAGGDTPDDDGGTEAADDMTENDDTNTDDPGEETDLTERVEQNAEQLEEYSDQMDELTSTVNDIAEAVADDGEEKTVEVETPDGEVYEVSESEAKSWFDGDEAGASSDPFADAPEWANYIKDQTDENAARIERINQQSGQSQQLDRSAGGDATEENPLDGLGKALN